MTRKVFIDCGSFDGDSVRAFRAKYPYADQYEIHCFEPDPRYAGCYEGLGVTFHPQAVSTHDGTADFYLGDPESSSLFRDKTSGNIDREHPVTVECVDLLRWMRINFKPEDIVVLKVDCEGIEYAILDEMLLLSKAYKSGMPLACVKDLYVDWHYDRIGIPFDDHKSLIERLKATGIPLHDCSRGHFLEYA